MVKITDSLQCEYFENTKLLKDLDTSIHDQILYHFPKIPECIILIAALNARFFLYMVYSTNM